MTFHVFAKGDTVVVRRAHQKRFWFCLATAVTAVAGVLLSTVMATSASAAIGGTFVPVAVPGSCTFAAGFSDISSSCHAGLGGNFYRYLPAPSNSISYSFTVPTGTVATLTYGIPAGGFVNTVAGTISIDGNGPYQVNTNLGAFDQTTPTDLSLWTSPVLGAGPHTWTIVSSGDSVNVYGVWIAQTIVTVPCGTGTTSCSAMLTAQSQTVAVTGSKTSPASASITVQEETATLSCTNFSYSAPIIDLTDTGLQSGTAVNIVDTVAGLPSKKGVEICYQPEGNSPPPPVLLGKCHGKTFTGACTKSVKEKAGDVVATLEVPAGDPRFHIGGDTPEVTSFSPAAPKAGKKLTIKGLNLSEVTKVTIGGVNAPVIKTAPTSVKVTAPAQAHGAIVVTSLAGVTASAVHVTVG